MSSKQLKLNSLEREATIEEISNTKYDLLIIGGGITGAGIALDAMSRGIKCLLIEKEDFAFGTSSRSTKLIHGGLRYLKQLEFALVREVGQERAIIHHNAPHLVIPDKMLLPIIKGGTYGKLASSFGLYVYDLLAGVKREERRVMLNKEETQKAEPLLRTDILEGGGIYSEYKTDDARLTIEVLKTAVARGAKAVNYLKAEDIVYDKSGKANGVSATDMINNKKINLQAKVIINAAGPWVDELRKKDNSLKGKRLRHTKGVHLVVGKDRLPIKQSIYFDIPDGRMMFAIPRGEVSYIGTTDTDFDKALDSPGVTKQDVEYLLAATNNIFPNVNLTEKDILSTWSGVRPLIHEDGKAPSELSRKDEIFISPSDIISIAGGKLTGFRKMAEKAVNEAAKRLGNSKPCETDKIVLSGGDFKSYQYNPDRYVDDLYSKFSNVEKAKIYNLVYKYGKNTEAILEQAHSQYADKAQPLVYSELNYTIENEGVVTLDDFFNRRTGMLYFDRPNIEKIKSQVEEYFDEIVNWNIDFKNSQHQIFEERFKEVLDFQ
jgi:glycerol-3-phosphate dehydrogenase